MADELSGTEGLSMAQRAALRTVDEIASRMEPDAYRRLTADLQSCECTEEMSSEATGIRRSKAANPSSYCVLLPRSPRVPGQLYRPLF